MARIGNKITGSWYTVDIVKTVVEDGQLVVYLNPETYTVNRRKPAYWYWWLRGWISLLLRRP